ncbi:elongation factor 1-delta isoform 3-T3 [Leptodactylus fuscus]|uniref:elongation factor 1-delta isoform X3 n=1 Tax=Leptodactylus fuscus TaxID=238119 RepID=UPI003F4ECEC6
MRTRKHQSPAESGWVDKHKCEDAAQLTCEAQTTPTPKKIEAPNGNPSEPAENSLNIDQKKVNGKKQKKRRRSPRNKASPSKVDSSLLGMMADGVWLEKYVYDEAECYYHTWLAAERAGATEGKPPTKMAAIKKHKAIQGTAKNNAAEGCCHSNRAACHHLSQGVWVNKFNFEDAESQFVTQYSSPLAPRMLNLNLVSHNRAVPRSSQKTPDEGYASATPTPATAPSPLTLNSIVSDPTVNGKPHWAGLQSLLSEVWLDKSLYDQAEARYYEHMAQAEPNLSTWSHNTGKRGKKDKWGKKSAGKQQPVRKKELASIPEENPNGLYYPAYYLHTDSERVWLDKSAYDKAEENFYVAQSHPAASAAKANKSPSVAKHPRPVKTRHGGKKDMAASFLSTEKIWFDKYKYDDAEKQYHERLSLKSAPHNQSQLRTVLNSPKDGQAPPPPSHSGPRTSTAAAPGGENSELLSRVASLEHENQSLQKVVKDLQSVISKLESRVSTLEKSATSQASAPQPPPVCKLPAPTPVLAPPAAAPKLKAEEEDDDDDIDLFGSDEEEDAEAARIKEERLRQYAEKKAKKPGLIAKSSILLDVKPWDDETDMAKLEECVRTVQMDGLLWGSSKLVPVGYGIKKLQIQCVVEDDKVGTDLLEEEITKFEDYVQSVDIAAFNKV